MIFESLKIGTLMGSFYLNLKICELQIYRGALYHDNEKWYKIWRGINISVQNWHHEFDEFLTQALKNLKILHFHGFLLNKVYNVWAKKSIGVFCLMVLNIDATFEGRLTCAFKNDMMNLANFHQSVFESLKNHKKANQGLTEINRAN